MVRGSVCFLLYLFQIICFAFIIKLIDRSASPTPATNGAALVRREVRPTNTKRRNVLDQPPGGRTLGMFKQSKTLLEMQTHWYVLEVHPAREAPVLIKPTV